MTLPKTFFTTNIRFLRIRKKMTQEALANYLEITRKKIDALENDRVKAPQPEDYLKYSDYFKVSIDTLLKVDLSKLGELKLRDLQAGNDVYMTGSKVRVLAITVDKNKEENMEFVPVKAKAGYSSGYSDPDFIAALPKFSLPLLPKGKTYRMFPITGDSMLPFPAGANIICYYVQDWRSLKPQTLCIAVLKGEQDFVFKQVTLQQDGLLMESLNQNYKPFNVPAADVLELWQYHSYHTSEVPEVQDMQSLASLIKNIQADIQVIKRKV